MRRLAVAGKACAGIVVIDHGEGESEVRLGDLLEGAQLAGEGKLLPAMLLRQLDGVEPLGAARLDGFQRIAPLPLPAGGIGGNMVLGESSGTRHDGALFGSQDLVQHAFEIHEWTSGATTG